LHIYQYCHCYISYNNYTLYLFVCRYKVCNFWKILCFFSLIAAGHQVCNHRLPTWFAAVHCICLRSDEVRLLTSYLGGLLENKLILTWDDWLTRHSSTVFNLTLFYTYEKAPNIHRVLISFNLLIFMAHGWFLYWHRNSTFKHSRF